MAVALPEDVREFRNGAQRAIQIHRLFLALFLAGNLLFAPGEWWLHRAHLLPFALRAWVFAPLAMFCIQGMAEWSARKHPGVRENTLIASGTLLALVTTAAYPEAQPLRAALLLPIVTSILHLQVEKVWLAGTAAFAAELALTLMPLSNRASAAVIFQSLGQLALWGLVLLWMTAASHIVLRFGLRIWNELRVQTRAQTELWVRQILSEKEAKTDALTGLYNRKSFDEYLDFALQISDGTNTPLHLAVIDIDNFKQINDQFGHLVGDEILRRTARAIQQHLAAGDFLARYGGEEFAVIIPEISHEQAVQHMEKIREYIANVHHVELDGHRATVSIGLSTHRPGETRDELFERADQCLYRAKQTGKNKIVAWESAMSG
ncbi:GGDEF domain-containing protein [Alicyclobacillus sendaiensis]|uniref:GGDEF domain-containing protein n=1 Tax=Alicyclobacillus sendaiensis TaxID=192387 RepID=UPI000780A62B|nr:sensor domain-containing diguanylate cyclase [Alicyclobacillus sendaiensis]